jgi:hypothetical protein
MKSTSAAISVEWDYEEHDITLTPRNWARVKSGKPLEIRGKGYHYEGEFFSDYWTFDGGISGGLLVRYGTDGADGDGFIGTLDDATITEKPHRAKRRR